LVPSSAGRTKPIGLLSSAQIKPNSFHLPRAEQSQSVASPPRGSNPVHADAIVQIEAKFKKTFVNHGRYCTYITFIVRDMMPQGAAIEMRPTRDTRKRRICATLKTQPRRRGTKPSPSPIWSGANLFPDCLYLRSTAPPARLCLTESNPFKANTCSCRRHGEQARRLHEDAVGNGVLLCSTWNIHRASSPRAALQPLALPTSRRALTLPAP
jgi:hypothetical protein